MIIRKIQKKNTTYSRGGTIFFGLLFCVFIGFVIVLTRSINFEKGTYNTEEQKIYDVYGREEGATIEITGKAYIHKTNENLFYILQTAENIKYILPTQTGDVLGIYDQQNIKVSGKVIDIIESYPYITANNIQNISGTTDHNHLSLSPSLQDAFETIIAQYYTPHVRPIPNGGTVLSSYKGYQMYFGKKVYYEVRKIRPVSLGIEGLSCDNIVYVVGDDKSKFVNSDPYYILNNARLTIHVCMYDQKDTTPPMIKNKIYTRTPNHTFHFYISHTYEAWEDIAQRIAVR